MTMEDVKRFEAEARALPASAVRDPDVPVHYRTVELHTAADFGEKYWEPDAATQRPGLRMVDFRLRYGTFGEVRALARAITMQQAMVLFGEPADQRLKQVVEQARELFESIGDALDFILDDEIDEPADRALEGARQRQAADNSIPALAQALVDVATIAEAKAEALAQLGDFDTTWVKQAQEIAGALQAKPSMNAGSAAVELRNRLLALADARVERVRSAARYVFRKHPELLVELPSRYELRRRLDRRRRQSRAGSPDAPAPTPAPTPTPTPTPTPVA